MSISDFESEIIRLEADREHTTGLIYGDSNAGKTVLVGTTPGKCFWLIGEPGYKSAATMGAKGMGRRLTDTASAWAAIEWLEHNNRYENYDCIIVDGFSTMQDRFRISYANEAFDANPATRQHRNIPDRPDYFNTQNFCKAWIPRLVDIPVNVLITAHAWRTNKTEDGDLLVFPGIQGKGIDTAMAICGLMDFVGYIEDRCSEDSAKWENGILFRTSIRNGVRYYAGDKTNTLGRYMRNPTMPKILRRMEG